MERFCTFESDRMILRRTCLLNQEDNLSFDPVRNESVWEYKQGDFLGKRRKFSVRTSVV
jgi:hypothetical protein